MPDFNQLAPPMNITDPSASSGAEYPRHLYKHAADASDTSVVVGWKAKQPVHNEVVTVADGGAKAAKLEEGWSLVPVLPDEKKAKGK